MMNEIQNRSCVSEANVKKAVAAAAEPCRDIDDTI